jgi:hypothetical protein
MAGTSQPEARPNWHVEDDGYAPTGRQSGWATYVVFAGVVMTFVGFLQLLAGLTALLDEDSLAVPADRLLVSASYAVWGWVHLVLGAVVMVAAYGLLRGAVFGRVLGVCAAGAGALVNMAFLPAHPWWASLAIAFDVVAIYAITVHGGELRTSG